jgi:hypothetical protein
MGKAEIEPMHLLIGLVEGLGHEAVNATVKQLRERIALTVSGDGPSSIEV